MEIQKLKASMQIAQMRFNSNGSEENKAVLEAAEKAYSDALDETEDSEETEAGSSEPIVPQPVIPQVQTPVAPKLAPLPKVVAEPAAVVEPVKVGEPAPVIDPEKKTEAQS